LAGVRDATAIAKVHVASWRGAYAGLLPQPLLDTLSVQRRAEQWRDQLADTEQVTLVAVGVTEEVIGFASVGASGDADADASTGELYAIYLSPLWGVGIGSTLHDAAVAMLSQRYTEATLWVLDGNTRARAFYERQGWDTNGLVREETRGGAVLNEVRYRRSL
jgi:ribosomal protein S18 acetylase RimI-like enzyme